MCGNRSLMHLIGKSALTKFFSAVEIDLWTAGFLLTNKTVIGRTLCTYSLDNGPLRESADGNLVFRFTSYDWQKNIRNLLVRHNIHYSVLGKITLNMFDQLLKKRIYVAEGSPDLSYSLSTILVDAGYHVKVSSGGKPIVDGSFAAADLFILDRYMPDIDGLDLCRHLRAQSATKDTPVIIISAAPKKGNEALEAGANAYLEKPFEMHYLLNVVSKYTRGGV